MRRVSFRPGKRHSRALSRCVSRNSIHMSTMWIAALKPPALNQFFGECTWFLCSLTVYDIKWVYVSASNENIDFTGDSCSVCGGVLLWQCRIIIKRFINLWSMKFPRCYSKPVIMSSFNENSFLKLTWTIQEKYRPRCLNAQSTS